MRELDSSHVPTLTAAGMREVDRIMIDELGIELLQMMENAGRTLAELARSRFGPQSVVVLAGPGGNGGGGLVAARHLANHGVDVRVVLGEGICLIDALCEYVTPVVAELGAHGLGEGEPE